MSVEYITDPSLGAARHGFFTREGGASSGVFKGLNCGEGSSDQSEIVALNRARAAAALGLDPGQLASVHQVHSADVVQIQNITDAKPKADAMVTDQPGLGLAVLTADCQPVLFADLKAGVIGAAHAGWKGAAAGVLEATIDAMEALGARAQDISAVIGPCISQKAYEVSQEFFEQFADENPTNTRFFVNGEAAGKYQFDLPAFGLAKLRARGVGSACWTGHCTYSDEARFYSYRRTTHRSERDYGRLVSIIRL